MKKQFLGTGLALSMMTMACSSSGEVGAPTFQVTSPTLATSSTTAPSTLEYVGLPELSGEENDMCEFVSNVGQDLASSDTQSRAAIQAAEVAAQSRTLSEPLRVRLLRDAELAKAQRFANVLKQFDQAVGIVEAIMPGPLTDQDRLNEDAADAAMIATFGAELQETIDDLRPLTDAEQAEFEERTGREWLDLFTEEEYDDVLSKLNNDRTGMGREGEAREAMERLDDWSWRHCAAGLTR